MEEVFTNSADLQIWAKLVVSSDGLAEWVVKSWSYEILACQTEKKHLELKQGTEIGDD